MSTGAAAEGGTGWIAVALGFATARLRDRQVSAPASSAQNGGRALRSRHSAELERGIEPTEQ
jgi:hypothetical protein